MAKTKSISILLLLTSAIVSFAFPSQETPVTRTHLMTDIEQSKVTIGAGLEASGEDPAYMGEMLFGYLGYAPFRWLEAGIAAHTLTMQLYPALDVKIDVLEFFSDSSPWSCLVMGGIGGLGGEADYPLFFHGGAAVNYRVARWLQLYAGAGSDTVASALALQVGLYLAPLKWLGASVNFKLAIGREGVAPMGSAALLAVLKPAEPPR